MKSAAPVLPMAVALAFTSFSVASAAEPPVRVPERWTLPSAPYASGQVDRWWRRFDDADLTRLVEQAFLNSPTVAAAEARVREARARRQQAASKWWPTITASTEARRLEMASDGMFASPGGTRSITLLNADLDASWEIDLFGRTRSAVRASDADAQAAREGVRDVFVSLAGEVADVYLQVRGLEARIGVVRANVATQSETADLTRQRVTAGASRALVASQAEAQLARTQASLPGLEEAMLQARHQLAFLCGIAPVELKLDRGTRIPAGPSAPGVGLPAELLSRRPDVRQAEFTLLAAGARVDEARAAMRPRLALAASGGFEAREIERLTNRDNLNWTIGPVLSIPLFTGGDLQARVRERRATRDAALATYESVVLRAMADVEDALVAVRFRANRVDALITAEAASRRVLDDSQQLFRAGAGNFLDVLEAQRSVLETQEQVVTARSEAARAKVRLFKSMGGDWVAQPAGNAAKPKTTLTKVSGKRKK